MREGIGLLLIGVAFAWALGSDSRWVYALFLAAGLTMMAWGGATWHRHAVNLAADQQALKVENEKQVPGFGPAVMMDEEKQRLESEATQAKGRALAGVALFGIGLGLLLGVKPQRSQA
ncbi:MAG TPA: hypothetical protein VNJ52_00160 [Patescibacteria group bacterium]|nr:hypothetical protein [Patescibacteria group bacterium]